MKFKLRNEFDDTSDPFFMFFLAFSDIRWTFLSLQELWNYSKTQETGELKLFTLRLIFGYVYEAHNSCRHFRGVSKNSPAKAKAIHDSFISLASESMQNMYWEYLNRVERHFSAIDIEAKTLSDTRNMSFHFASNCDDLVEYEHGYKYLYDAVTAGEPPVKYKYDPRNMKNLDSMDLSRFWMANVRQKCKDAKINESKVPSHVDLSDEDQKLNALYLKAFEAVYDYVIIVWDLLHSYLVEKGVIQRV